MPLELSTAYPVIREIRRFQDLLPGICLPVISESPENSFTAEPQEGHRTPRFTECFLLNDHEKIISAFLILLGSG